MNQLEYYLVVLRRRWLIVLIGLAVGTMLLPLIGSLIPSYSADAELLVVSEALKDTSNSDMSLPAIVTSTEVLAPIIKHFNLDTDPVALAKKIKTKASPKSSILSLKYHDTDRRRAAEVVNAIADKSASYYHEIAMRGYREVLLQLNRSIAQSKTRIANADKRLQHSSALNAFASSDRALDELTTRIEQLVATRGQINANLAADRATASGIRLQLARIHPIIRGEVLQKDVVYQQLQAGFAKDVADLTSERSSFHDNFPGLAALQRRVEREQTRLKAAESVALDNGAGLSPSSTQTVLDGQHADTAVEADAKRLITVDAQLNEEQKHLREVAGAGALVGTLRAERDAELQEYLTLTQRLGTAQADAAQAASLGSLVVVSRAVPGNSTLWLWLAIFGLVFAGLSIAIALCVDFVDRRLWGTREIENVYGRPVLAEVGKI